MSKMITHHLPWGNERPDDMVDGAALRRLGDYATTPDLYRATGPIRDG